MSSTISRLGTWDYVSGSLIVLIATCIAVYHMIVSKRATNVKDFLVRNQNMGIFPLVLSIAATFSSAVGFLGFPTETYNNGVSFMVLCLSFLLLLPFGIYFYMPVFYELDVSSTFEYFELRFNRCVRLCASILINVQLVLYTSCVIYAPALTLNQVTGLHLWTSIATIGIVCIIYTSIGGFKAVVWADTTQCLVMTVVFLVIFFKETTDLGGLAEVWRICTEGNRTQFFVLGNSPYTTYSFWSMAIGGTFYNLGFLATNQLLMQRYMSNRTLKNAQISFIGGSLMIGFLVALPCAGGLIMYARYHDCDPLISGQVTARDQMMALFAMETLGFVEGLPGVFVAAIMCATLSTLSSALNSLSTISIEDYIKPCYPHLSEATQLRLSKLIAFAYGTVCIALILLAQNLKGLVQTTMAIFSVTGGPVFALFTIGMALPFVNSWGAMSGFFAGLLLTGWASIGNQILIPPMPHAPYSTSGCNITSGETSFNHSVEAYGNFSVFAPTKEIFSPLSEPESFFLYTIPSIWYASWSCGIGLVIAIIVSMATGFQRPEELDPRLFFPLTRKLFMQPCLVTCEDIHLPQQNSTSTERQRHPSVKVTELPENN